MHTSQSQVKHFKVWLLQKQQPYLLIYFYKRDRSKTPNTRTELRIQQRPEDPVFLLSNQIKSHIVSVMNKGLFVFFSFIAFRHTQFTIKYTLIPKCSTTLMTLGT